MTDTYNGGAMMSNDETTLAEILKENNYQTGIFGNCLLYTSPSPRDS